MHLGGLKADRLIITVARKRLNPRHCSGGGGTVDSLSHKMGGACQLISCIEFHLSLLAVVMQPIPELYYFQGRWCRTHLSFVSS
jgi:hypothetical protein